MSQLPVSPPWPVLISLWRQYLAEPQLPFIDRWLKQQFNAAPGKKPVRKATVSLSEQLLVSRCLMAAPGWAQLACALELGYRAQVAGQPQPDWDAWDQGWQTGDLNQLAPTEFWYWVGLRQGWDLQGLRLPDAPARYAFYQNQQVTEASLSAWSLLWFGLRPQWAGMLEERCCTCGWNMQQLQTFIQQQNCVPPLWLRPQQGQTSEQLRDTLAHQGVEVELRDGHLCALGGRGLASTEAYKAGQVEIQDLASQLIAQAVAAQPGQKVWDTCAGAGGKSLAIAARLNNKGMLLATDLHAHKLDELKRRAKRAGFYNLRSFTWDASAPLQQPREVAQQQGFDWVLVDAPCTASGTWRRNPDARWRFNNADTRELLAIQKQILTCAAAGVRPGGRLVYATCSWQWAENEGQVREFLQANLHFELVQQQLLGAPALDADTMFVAVLKRLS